MAVGLNATLVDALIYAMSKYCALNSALNSDKGYSVGQKYIGYIEHTKQVLQATNGAEAAALERLELIGRAADDLLSIKGSRAYVSAMNAPVVDRLLQPVQGSFLSFVEENKPLAKGKATSKIIAGHSTHISASEALALSSVWLAGPTIALKVQGLAHTLSATSLSEVALRRTCTESIRRKSTLKTALTKKKQSALLAPSA